MKQAIYTIGGTTLAVLLIIALSLLFVGCSEPLHQPLELPDDDPAASVAHPPVGLEVIQHGRLVSLHVTADVDPDLSMTLAGSVQAAGSDTSPFVVEMVDGYGWVELPPLDLCSRPAQMLVELQGEVTSWWVDVGDVIEDGSAATVSGGSPTTWCGDASPLPIEIEVEQGYQFQMKDADCARLHLPAQQWIGTLSGGGGWWLQPGSYTLTFEGEATTAITVVAD